MLKIENINVFIEDKEILKDFSINIEKGNICALMGLNGSGKSTLASSIMGFPHVEVRSGNISYNDIDLLDFSLAERSRMGIFLSYQSPISIPGITVGKFLKKIYSIHRQNDTNSNFIKELLANLERLALSKEFINRYLNDGFSGGERKKLEMLQILMTKPSFVMLDEIDSGLDIEAVNIITKIVNELKQSGTTFLIISHYKRLFDFIKPDTVAIIHNKQIAVSGGYELVEKVEKNGYSWIQ